jgi:phage gp36-like protein
MSYASVDDMVLQFGEAEMIAASTPDNTPATVIVAPFIQAALDTATAMIDSYLRKRYRVPLDVAPPEVNTACMMLARYQMGLGGQRQPAEQTVKERDNTIRWLRDIADGRVVLGLEEAAPGDESFATTQSRTPMFGDGNEATGYGGLSGGGCYDSWAGGNGGGGGWP